MKKVLIVLGALLVLGIGAFVLVVVVAANKFGPMAEKFLVDWKAGKHAEVYAAASKDLRAATSFEALEASMKGLEDRLGAFRGVKKTTGGGVSASTETGTTGKVSNVLEYEKGTAKGDFTFRKEDGEWRLLGLHIVPEEGADAKPER